MKVANGEFKTLKIYGNDYDTHDGTAIRDYIHVDDLASGHIKALNVIRKKPQLIVANLGTGIGYSVLDVVKAVEKVSNQRIIYQFSERRAGDAEISYSDPSYAKEILNWQVKYSLEDMCYDSWNYTLKN